MTKNSKPAFCKKVGVVKVKNRFGAQLIDVYETNRGSIRLAPSQVADLLCEQEQVKFYYNEPPTQGKSVLLPAIFPNRGNNKYSLKMEDINKFSKINLIPKHLSANYKIIMHDLHNQLAGRRFIKQPSEIVTNTIKANVAPELKSQPAMKFSDPVPFAHEIVGLKMVQSQAPKKQSWFGKLLSLFS